MSETFCHTRKEIFVVALRMGGYRIRHKFYAMLDSQPADSATARTFRKTLPKIVAPKSLIMEISFPEKDTKLPVDRPGVLLKEICVETGKVFSEFQISLEEAKNLRALLVENLGE